MKQSDSKEYLHFDIVGRDQEDISNRRHVLELTVEVDNHPSIEDKLVRNLLDLVFHQIHLDRTISSNPYVKMVVENEKGNVLMVVGEWEVAL